MTRRPWTIPRGSTSPTNAEKISGAGGILDNFHYGMEDCEGSTWMNKPEPEEKPPLQKMAAAIGR